jgi:hypothetical protein
VNIDIQPSVVVAGSPLALFTTVISAYQKATAVVGSIERWYSIAGHTVRICFAGPALPPLLTPALEHLMPANPDVEPDLTIYVWDSRSTGVPPPPCPWTQQQLDLRGEAPAYSDERFLTAAQHDVNAFSIFDRLQKIGVYWIDESGSLRAYERAAPLKVILHWWLREHRLPMVHAGVVGTAQGAALLIGKTGAGKSTTTLACLSAGMHYVADDRCLLKLEPEPQALCIYNSAKVYPKQMQLFPQLLPAITNQHELAEEKALVYVNEVLPHQIAHRLPIRVLLLAKISGNPATTISEVSRIAVLRELSTSTLVYQPGAAHEEVHAMSELVRRVPCYQLNLGTDLMQIPSTITQIIDEIAQQSGSGE